MEAVLIVVLSGVVAFITASLTRRAESRAKLMEARDQRLARYREPLAQAANDLQSRLYNIVLMDFLDYAQTPRESDEWVYAVRGTEWLIGQYLARSEILRRQIQFLDLGSSARNQQFVALDEKIRAALASDRGALPRALRTFRLDQRAIGEIMTVEPKQEWQRSECLAYTEFLRRRDLDGDPLFNHFQNLEEDIIHLAVNKGDNLRAIEIQRRLIDLLDYLDDDRSRFSLNLRGKIPVGPPLTPRQAVKELDSKAQRGELAHFRLHASPWASCEAWAGAHSFSGLLTAANEQTHMYVFQGYRRRAVVSVTWVDDWVTIFAAVYKRNDDERAVAYPTMQGGYLDRKITHKLRTDVNVLLCMFDRPIIRLPGRITSTNQG